MMLRAEYAASRIGSFCFSGGNVKRFFVLSCNPIFNQGVQELLSHHTRMQMVGREAIGDQALAHIQELGPDIVIVDAGHPTHDRTSLVLRILEDMPGVQVVELSLENNTITIFRKQQTEARSVDDFMKAIEEHGSESPSESDSSSAQFTQSRVSG
jgi:DNA-binding NarL/FixJ family response regulator